MSDLGNDPCGDPCSDPMSRALELARLAGQEGEVPVGAVIVREGSIVGEGRNRRESAHDPVGHAEIVAIQEAARRVQGWRLDGCRLFVTLEPCPMCLAAAQLARIDEVIYGAVDPKGGALSLGYRLNEDVKTNHRFPAVHEPRPECGEILTRFFESRRRSSKK